MKLLGFTTGLLTCLAFSVSATTRFVDVNNAAPSPPYTNWATAATNIQVAIDAADPGDQILVTNGVYQTGGRPSSDGTTNRVAVTISVTLQSVNGAVTVIDGGNTMRCVYLTNGAALIGFTLTNGTAENGGGVACASTNALISNCVLTKNSASYGGGAYSGTLSNCTVIGNSIGIAGGGAYNCILNKCILSGNQGGSSSGGAGAYSCTLNDCTLTGNTTSFASGGGANNCNLRNCTLTQNSAYGAGRNGGGAYNSTLIDCTISDNYADYGGGGAYNCVLTNCTVSQNSSGYSGGGVTGSTLKNCVVSGNDSGYGGGANYNCLMIDCTITGNYASYGGGVYNGCTLYNCVLSGNSAGGYGGGAHYCTLNNCTVSGNTAQLFGGYGGGAYYGTLNNCIVYYNTGGAAGPDTYGSSLNYCCTPTATGVGNITNAPLFVSGGDFHLQSGSLCINSGNNIYVTGSSDLDGNLRIAGVTVDMGAYEFQAAGPLTVSIQANLTNVPVGYPVFFSGVFSKGRANSWNFGDGTVVSNQLSVSHSWASAGDYPVVLTAYDSANPGGVSASLTIHVKTQIVYYVNVAGMNPVPPYDSWNTAATNIQDAIDVALPVPQSLVLATNGIYQSGGRVAYSSLTNRVVINKRIMVQSLNGPAVTVIRGNPIVGNSAVRCVYVTNSAVLAGFTLTGGATYNAGDSTREQSGGGVWCESASATISNCVVSGNVAVMAGGGVYGGTLYNCTISSNSNAFIVGSGNGGGAAFGSLNHCLLFNNLAGYSGGGADNCALTNCVLASNQTLYGGGANNSTLTGCSLTGNSATWEGGGANSCTINNCTLTGNSSGRMGGGVKNCTVNNSILYHNMSSSDANFSASGLNYCCTLPLPEGGSGNIIDDPQLTDSAHISIASPCKGTGSSDFASGADVDGEAWLNPPSVGCDEFNAGLFTGMLSVAIKAGYSNVATGFVLDLSATISGHATVSVWDFGDGTMATNRMGVSHAWSSPGDYSIVLTAYNDSKPGGVKATNIVHVMDEPIHYVSLDSTNPVSPFLSWNMAATNIQGAVDAAFGGATILVTNGIYRTGGRVVYGSLTNRVVINKAVTVQSVNGPKVTIIQGNLAIGDSAIRCAYIINGATLIGFTLTNGATRAFPAGDFYLEDSAGGVWCESSNVLVSDCVLAGNSASFVGGGAYQGTLTNCVLVGNSASGGGGASASTLNNCMVSNNSGGGATSSLINNSILINNSALSGGGAYSCTLNNCTIIGNSAVDNIVGGGGVAASTVKNCIIYSNVAPSPSAANHSYSVLNHCCTTPLPPSGMGNITNQPLFADPASGNFHLQSNSPCINSGQNAYVTANADLDGRPRIVNDTVDIGAYEFQGAGMAGYITWLHHFYLPTDGSADYTDADGDGRNNWQEWIAGTDPTNAISVLRQFNPIRDASGLLVSWQSASGVRYFLERSTNLSANPAFLTLATDIPGQPGMTTYTDTNAVGLGPFFYRIGIQTDSNQFQTAFSFISFAWLQKFGLPTDGSADFAHNDTDGMNNWQEWKADTIPTNSQSVLRMTALSNGLSGTVVQWQSTNSRTYFLERAANLGSVPSFSGLASNIVGQALTTTYTDSTATNGGPFFYRVGVQE